MKLLYTIIFSLLFFLPQNDDFIFNNGNQKITLKIDDGKRNLNWGITSILNLKVNNINPLKMNISAPGIKFIKSENDKSEMNLQITPTKEIIEKDSLNLRVSYRDENNEYVSHKFSILIKE